jgi:hypothetical protein
MTSHASAKTIPFFESRRAFLLRNYRIRCRLLWKFFVEEPRIRNNQRRDLRFGRQSEHSVIFEDVFTPPAWTSKLHQARLLTISAIQASSIDR